jgi:ribonuclease-3
MGIVRWALSFFRAPRPRAGSAAADIDFPKLESILGYSIRDREYFSEALSHRSYLQISPDEDTVSNERLEFLGDAVLNLVAAEFLFQRDPRAPEGELTKIRSRLVNKKALGVFARERNLVDFMLMSPSALQVPGRGMETILADAFEAIIGAIYLDGGFDEAKKFVEGCIRGAFDHGTIPMEDENFKSRLLERTQSEGIGSPRYVTTNEAGPDHDRTFTIDVYVGNVSYGTGFGKNKKDAEQAAAEKALQRLDRRRGKQSAD